MFLAGPHLPFLPGFLLNLAGCFWLENLHRFLSPGALQVSGWEFWGVEGKLMGKAEGMDWMGGGCLGFQALLTLWLPHFRCCAVASCCLAPHDSRTRLNADPTRLLQCGLLN